MNATVVRTHVYRKKLPTSHRPQEVSGQCYFKNENETVNILPESNLLTPRYPRLGVLGEGPQNIITNTDN